MSAFLCSQDLINLIVNANAEPSEENFAMLVRQNIDSIYQHYNPEAREDAEIAETYVFERIDPRDLIGRVYKDIKGDPIEAVYPATSKPVTSARAAAQIVVACDCYDYKAETFDYRETEAAVFVRAVRDAFINRTTRSFMSEAVWGF